MDFNNIVSISTIVVLVAQLVNWFTYSRGYVETSKWRQRAIGITVVFVAVVSTSGLLLTSGV